MSQKEIAPGGWEDDYKQHEGTFWNDQNILYIALSGYFIWLLPSIHWPLISVHFN